MKINKQHKEIKIVTVIILLSFIFVACQGFTDNNEKTVDPKTYVKLNVTETDDEEIKALGYDYNYDNLSYELIWSDEFDYDGFLNETKWNYDVGGEGWGNKELQYYTNGGNVYVKDGTLIMESRKEEKEGMDYTSARITTKDKGDWIYGKIEVCAKLPAGIGTWPAIWMVSTDEEYGHWPTSGEIDIMEHVGFNQNAVEATIHTQTYCHIIDTSKTASKYVEGASEKFHVYSIEWLPDMIMISVDNELYFTYEPSVYKVEPTYKEWPFDKRMHLILNIAIGGSWGGKKGVNQRVFPVQMLVDYVRVYQSKEISMLSK